MEGNIIDVESDSTTVLVTKHTFLGGPLEASHDGVLDFVQVLHSLGAIHHDVRSIGFGAKAPDLTGLGDVIFVLVSQIAATRLEVVTGIHLALE